MNEVIESRRGEIYRAHQRDEQLRRDQQLLHEQLLEQNRDLREAHEKSLNEMEELKRYQGSPFDTNSRRKLVEDRHTTLELTGKIQELQNELNCMNDSREKKDAESVSSGQYHLTNQPAFFQPFRLCTTIPLIPIPRLTLPSCGQQTTRYSNSNVKLEIINPWPGFTAGELSS